MILGDPAALAVTAGCHHNTEAQQGRRGGLESGGGTI